ncbi:MAG: TrkH family potassium uptake protein [Rubellimicrobium sp.]|nr:TrkH family potassium uptake protein [Rubellimicrobium sp.]
MAGTTSSEAAPDALDLRPLVNVVGRIVVVLGLLMLLPAAVDWGAGHGNAGAFLFSALVTAITGLLMALATRGTGGEGLSLRQAYFLTFLIWTILPLFGSLPFMLGEPGLSMVDAYFESVSGLTTTGSTVITGLDHLPPGVNLWRGLVQWAGGLGIVFVAMIFLPFMRVGGMQFFRAENFDTMGKVLPRAADIAAGIAQVYLILTALALIAYAAAGMTPLDTVVNAMATVSTGGVSSSDASLGKYPGVAEYLGGVLMAAAALPYVRYVQLLRGRSAPLLADPQVRFFLGALTFGVAVATGWGIIGLDLPFETALRESFFNITSITTGTGLVSGSFAHWEGPALIVAFILGLMGGCSGSSTAAMSAFRVQLSLTVLWARIRQIQSPNRIVPIRYAGKPVSVEVVDSLMVFMSAFVLGLGLFAVAITLTGVDSFSALNGAWMALCNIGYGFGPLATIDGTFRHYPDAAKMLMALAMLLGRLGLLSVFVIVLPRFWQR